MLYTSFTYIISDLWLSLSQWQLTFNAGHHVFDLTCFYVIITCVCVCDLPVWGIVFPQSETEKLAIKSTNSQQGLLTTLVLRSLWTVSFSHIWVDIINNLGMKTLRVNDMALLWPFIHTTRPYIGEVFEFNTYYPCRGLF